MARKSTFFIVFSLRTALRQRGNQRLHLARIQILDAAGTAVSPAAEIVGDIVERDGARAQRSAVQRMRVILIHLREQRPDGDLPDASHHEHLFLRFRKLQAV